MLLVFKSLLFTTAVVAGVSVSVDAVGSELILDTNTSAVTAKSNVVVSGSGIDFVVGASAVG